MLTNEIISIYGDNYTDNTIRLLESAGLEQFIGNKNANIILKPNLVVAGNASNGAVTHPEIVAGVIEYLQNHGFKNITLIEGSWVGDDTDRAFRISGIGKVCEDYKIPYFNTKKDKYMTISADGHSFNVSQRLENCDVLINLPVLKGHCQTLMTCALKNHKGLLSDSEKRRFHSQGLHEPIAYLSKAILKNTKEFIVVDNICGDLDFEEGGNPVYNGRIFCCTDPVMCDSYVCSFMGYDTSDVPYVEIASRIGAGNIDISSIKMTDANSRQPKADSTSPSGKVLVLGKYVDAQDACSACYAALIGALNRLNEEGLLDEINQTICIGQGFRKRVCNGIGVGNCTLLNPDSIHGCPPSQTDIYDYLKSKVM